MIGSDQYLVLPCYVSYLMVLRSMHPKVIIDLVSLGLEYGDSMLDSQIISLASTSLAFATVCVAAWQVRVSTKSTDKSNALPIISEIFREWRTSEFNKASRRLLGIRRSYLDRENFNALPRGLRRDAYKVCYFFDYLGVLVLYDIVRQDIIIGVMATRLTQVWSTMSPIIEKERGYRIDNYPPETPPGFLVYYEHLVKLVEASGGNNAARIAQQRAGVLNIASKTKRSAARKILRSQKVRSHRSQ